MKVDPRVEMSAPVAPVIKRIPGNPVLSVNVKTEGCLNPVSLNAVNLDFSGTARLADIESVTVVRGGEKPEFPEGAVTFPEDPAQVLGTVRISGGMKPRISVRGNLELEPGDNHLWVCVTMKDGASLDGKVVVRPASVVAGNKLMKVADAAPVAQRIGVAVVKPGDFNSKFYRIPGLVRTKKGTLLAVYDIRYNHSGDLPANIDVGVSRSTDGGRTWSDVKIAVDDSKIDPARKDAKAWETPPFCWMKKTAACGWPPFGATGIPSGAASPGTIPRKPAASWCSPAATTTASPGPNPSISRSRPRTRTGGFYSTAPETASA